MHRTILNSCDVKTATVHEVYNDNYDDNDDGDNNDDNDYDNNDDDDDIIKRT